MVFEFTSVKRLIVFSFFREVEQKRDRDRSLLSRVVTFQARYKISSSNVDEKEFARAARARLQPRNDGRNICLESRRYKSRLAFPESYSVCSDRYVNISAKIRARNVLTSRILFEAHREKCFFLDRWRVLARHADARA